MKKIIVDTLGADNGSTPILSGALRALTENSDIFLTFIGNSTDIADAVSVLNIMAEGTNDMTADVNGDGTVDIADFVSVLNFMAQQ